MIDSNMPSWISRDIEYLLLVHGGAVGGIRYCQQSLARRFIYSLLSLQYFNNFKNPIFVKRISVVFIDEFDQTIGISD